jgi:hypothetical protein
MPRHRAVARGRRGLTGETADAVEVAAFAVFRARAAIADVGTDVCERGQQRTRFDGEGVLASGACAVKPPDLAIGMRFRQSVEHRENGRCANARADQQHGRVCRTENEGATGGCDVELVADGESAV